MRFHAQDHPEVASNPGMADYSLSATLPSQGSEGAETRNECSKPPSLSIFQSEGKPPVSDAWGQCSWGAGQWGLGMPRPIREGRLEVKGQLLQVSPGGQGENQAKDLVPGTLVDLQSRPALSPSPIRAD